MKYDKPIMDIIFFDEISIVTSSIQDGVFGEVYKEYEKIPGDEF